MTYSHRTYATAALFLTSSILQLPTRFQTSHFLTVVDAADISPATFSQFNNPPNEIAAVPSHNNNNNNQFFMGSYPTYAATGPIGDATCDVEQLEQANDSQLHVILAELMTTSFFRSFAVDLDERCPLAGWNTKKKKNKKSEKKDGAGATTSAKDSSSTSSTTTMNVPTTLETSGDGEEEEEGCAGELPDLDPDAEPACSVDLGGGQPGFLGGGGGGGGAFSSGFSSSSTSSTTSTSLPPSFSTEATADTSTTDEDEDEEEFECDGGKDELDDDAEPLCSLATDESQNNNPFFGGGNNNNNPTDESAKFASAALSRVGDQSSWESESQQQTFQWARPSDPVIENYDEPCGSEVDQAGNLPETFWLDMCSQIHAGDGLSIVNLQLNPERNTGYNGTHIWNAIYEENCLALDGSASAPMCYEERVLYRLLSGLHTSTTLSIAKNYYPPSKRKGRVNWEPNAQYFIDKFADHPEHLRNLHFSYVVLLRALKKASPFLYNYEIKTGDILDDEMATILLRRLLDSTILRSCHDVFTAFDENLMFKEQSTAISLQENFKGVFHNVSSILDCVQCQQCKLHGKMAMLGYGTALKILFLPEGIVGKGSLSRNEIVAFLNTIAKMSESVREVRELTHLYWSTHERLEKSDEGGSIDSIPSSSAAIDGVDVLDAAVGAVSSLANQGLIDESAEAKLIQQAFQRNPELMVLSKHYGNDLRKFLNFLPNLDSQIAAAAGVDSGDPDAIVVGTGLAGLAATLNILDRGGRVTLIEKEHRMGGNSNKASSGINACCPQNATYGDDLETFMKDTTRSAGQSARPHLIETLVGNSESAVQWLKDRVGVDLSMLAQLGGHGHKRTHRPSSGMVGAEVIYNIQRAVKSYEKTENLKILMDTRVVQLVRDEDGSVIGVEAVTTNPKDGDNTTQTLTAPNVVLATGGFASDRSPGSYLEHYRPELMNMPATAGEFSTGDGITLGTSVGAGLVDMDKVQVHPTGWVDPKDPSNPGKVLSGELMRGVGGILINQSGKRFCNELGTRAYVTDKMLSHDSDYEQSKKWNVTSEVPTFSLVLSSSAAESAKKHVDHYINKGLLVKLEGLHALAKWMDLPVYTVRDTLREYQHDSTNGSDAWGKTSFSGVPQADLATEVFYAGTVTPVLHYCMGGLTIDKEGSVLDEDKNIIPGLHAAGEVSGGVHGDNRLGGNSLLECTVFGTIVGKKIPIKPRQAIQQMNQNRNEKEQIQIPKMTMVDVEQHNSEGDCWIAIHDKVYDLTEFAEEHPAGPESIIELAGQDGTEDFAAVHSEGILQDFDPVGIL
mmetsp:Transcript_34338/g.72249  ORF Transcript_34338/g.72249 Transcript_34338/m.72249 type:complete len:1299 (+) Transcript_34338:130-4026(+)